MRCIRNGIGALALALASGSGAVTFSVNSDDDAADNNVGNGSCWTGSVVSGPGGLLIPECTLRAAIMETDALGSSDTIVFGSSIPTDGLGFVRISPGSPLPAITSPLVIDGTTAPGYDTGDPAQVPIIQIDGSGAGFTPGLTLSVADGSEIHALALHDFSSHGLHILTSDHVVEGCHIGITSGTTVAGNGGDGIQIAVTSQRVRIGPFCTPTLGCVGRGNVVSGNAGDGIDVRGLLTIINGNRIGTRADGLGIVALLAPTGNGGWGVRTLPDALGLSSTQVGSFVETIDGPETSGNLISGNGAGGVLFEGSGNRVQASLIGTLISGSGDAGNTGPGVEVRGHNSFVGPSPNFAFAGNVISGNDGPGVLVSPSTYTPTFNISIQTSMIGTDSTGSVAIANDGGGIELTTGSEVVIFENTISGNLLYGIAGSSETVYIFGNRIGTNASGQCLGNEGNGILAQGPGWLIGSPPAGPVGSSPNVVGCNGDRGIFIDFGAPDALVQANYVGTDALGAALGNLSHGIEIGSSDAQIGGSMDAGEGNVIGFNEHGIFTNSSSFGSRIRGNHIGTDAAADDLGNTLSGVFIGSSAQHRVGDLSLAGGQNEIAFNGMGGVYVFGATAVTNPIRGNSIHDNTGLGIELDPLGANPNDPTDADSGPNRLQNYPVLDPANATYDTVLDQVSIDFDIDSQPPFSTFPLAIDFYVADASGEGEAWIGSVSVGAPGPATAIFAPTPGVDLLGVNVVATATTGDFGGEGSTSEFSASVPLPEPSVASGLAAGALLLRAFAVARRRRIPGDSR